MTEKATTTEQKILRAAEKIFQQKGFTGTRMQEVADEADINKAMLHYYFRSKEKLFRVILTNAINEVFPVMIGSLSSDKDIVSKLHDLVTNHTTLLLNRPHLPLFIIYELSQNQGKFVTDLVLTNNAQPVVLAFFQQVIEAGEAGKIYPISPVQLLLHVLSLTVFPFIARPVVATVANLPGELFQQVLKERTKEVIRLLDAGLKP